MTVSPIVEQLIARFIENLATYRSGEYKEAETRLEFIDPLFVTLGWDVTNTAGVAPALREVVVEYSMKIGSYTKAPDYLFG